MSLQIDKIKSSLSNSTNIDIETLEAILILANNHLECYSNNDIVVDREDDAPIVINKPTLKSNIKRIYESFNYVDDDIAPKEAELKIIFCDY